VNLVRAEVLKVRTTRGWYAYLAVVILLTGIAVAGDTGSTEDARRSLLEFQLGLVDTAGIASLIAIILGITIVTTEFRHGTITPTVLVEPHRERVVGAKTVATAVLSLLFAALALVVVAAVAIPWLSVIDAEIRLGESEIRVHAAQVLLVSVLWGLMGVAIGALVQSQVAALVGTLVWLFLVETLLVGIFGWLDVEGVIPYLPFQALDAADGTGGEEILSYWPGVLVSLAWIAVLGVAGTERLRRRDIS
jgi:ABC-type transport system involved in multi-copper enzyme maturation permease subunit